MKKSSKNIGFIFLGIFIIAIILFLTSSNKDSFVKKDLNSLPELDKLSRNWEIINFTPEYAVVNGLNVFYYVPENAKGVVFFYHGTGGQAASVFNKVEMLHFSQYAVDRGYGIVSTESQDRFEGKWITTNNPATNKDVKQWQAVERFLKKEGLLKDGMKRFGAGMSRGASFVSYVGGYLEYDGVAQYNAGGLAGVFNKEGYKVPTLFHYSENDVRVNNSDILDNYELVTNKGIRTLLLEKKEEVLKKDQFMRIPGISEPQSEDMFNRFVSIGYVYQNGTYTGVLDQYSWQEREAALVDEVDALFLNLNESLDPFKRDFIDQYRVVIGEHEFHAGYAKETFDFFEEIN